MVSALTRHVGQLSVVQLGELKVACAGYGVAFRGLHGADRPLTPKGHLIEKHIMYFANKYGTCGSFGEDGTEALHPLATAVRIITRNMRNAEQRFLASMAHEQIRQLSMATCAKKNSMKKNKK